MELPTHDPARQPAATDALPNFTHAQIVRVLTGILLCILLAAVDQTVVVPAVPAIAADLNGFGHLSWILSAYLITTTAATPIYGKLSDIYGRRPLLMIGLTLFIAASVLCALAQTLVQLIVFRALQGLGGAGLMAMSQAVIADVVAPRERGRYQGYMAGTWGVACVFGPILGGWMTDHLSWHWIFWINVPIGLAAIMLSNRALKLLKTRHVVARIDYLGAALLTGFITACLLVMSWGGVDYAWGSPEILGTTALAVVLLGALMLQERRAIDPLLPPRLFANSVFNSGVAIAFLAAGGLFGATFLLPLFFQLVRGADASTSGSMIVPFLATSTVGAFASGQLARRLGRTKAIVLGGLAGAVLGFGLLATMDGESSAALGLVYMSIVGFGIGICMPSSMVIVQNAVERRDVGAATGALLFLRSMGSALGSTLVGSLLAIGFSRNMVAAGVTREIDLGALREAGGSALRLDAATAAVAGVALASSFQMAFAACAGLSFIAFLVCLAMRDLPLQSSGKGR